jgi:signal transduction histidine kinase
LNLSWRQSATYRRLAGPNLFNWRLFWWSYLLLFIPQILFDVVAFDAASWLWLPIWTSSHLAATALVLIVKLLGFDRFQAKHPSALANLLLASVAGIIRVVWVGEISYVQGLVTEFDLEARIGSGVILGVLLFVALTNLLEINKSYALALRGLLRTQNQLNQLRKAARKEVTQIHSDLAADTRRVVEPRLGEIARLLKGQKLSLRLRNSVTRDLSDILENQVRPLNRSLRSFSASIDSANLQAGVSRKTLFRIPQAVQADLAISPFWILVLLLGVMPFSLYIFESASWALLGVVTSLFNFVLISIARFFLRRQKLVPLETAIFQYFYLVVQLVIANYAVFLLAGYPEQSVPFVLLMMFITLTFTIIAVGLEAVQEHNRSDFLNQIARNNSRIERELGLLNQRVWVEKRRWALTIHGTVQASLTAALARLKAGERLSSADLEKISQHVLQAKKGLSGPQPKSFDLNQAIRQQKKTWDGIMSVQVVTKGSEFKSLESDLWAGFCANEIIKEGLSNAFRHGSAKKAVVKFQSEKPGFVTIEITNDGKALSKTRNNGLGSQLLDEIAYPWSLSKVPKVGTVLRAQIPVSKSKPSKPI